MGSETEPGRPLKDLFKQAPSVADSLKKTLSMIRRPGGPAWPERLQLKSLSEEKLPKAATEVGEALVGLTEKTLPRLLEERRKIGKEGLNGNNGRLTENPLLKPPSRLVLPDGQQILTLSEIGKEILGLVINASNQSLDLSDKKLEYSHPEFFSKGNTARFRVQVSRLRNKLSKLGWSIQTVDFITGPNGRRGKLELRKIKNPDNNSENKESASRSTEPVQQKPQPIDDSSLPAQEPAATPTVPKEPPEEVTIVDFSPNNRHVDLASPGSGQYPASQGETLQGLRGQIELAKPVEPSRSNPIPVILPDGSKGSRTWGRTRKILETLIEAHKEGRIFSKKEIWQRACPEIPFEKAGPIISGAADNLRYDMTHVGWLIETVQTPKGEPVTYALRKKGAHRLEYIPESIQRAATKEKPLPHPLPAADTKGSKHTDLPPYESVRAPKPEQKPIINNGLPPTADIFRKISNSDRRNGKSGATVLFEGEREEKIIDSIREASRIILSQTLAGKLERIKGATPRSLIESALPIGASFDILFKIDSQEEFNQRFIEAIMSQWRRLLSDNHTLLSIKEIEDRQKLLDLGILGFTMEKMEIIIRALFKTKPPILASTKDK